MRVVQDKGKGRISLKQMMDLCRQLGHNLTSTDKDVIATEFRLGGESYRASVSIVL